MAALANLSREERIGLLIAGTAHVALAVVLMLQDADREPIEPPKRITVSLAEEVALDTASPDPSPDPAAALAPVLAPMTEPEVLKPPEPKPTPRARPTPTPTASRRPTPTPTASRRPTPTPTASRRPTPTPTASASRRPTPTPTPTATRSGGGRVSAESMRGLTEGTGRSGDAAPFGATQQAALNSAVTRQLRPNWTAPTGVDVDRLVTVIEWELNEDGSLRGSPLLVEQTGVTDGNRLQAPLHVERAMRAVRAAAPFPLPREYYSRWRRLRWQFDRRL